MSILLNCHREQDMSIREVDGAIHDLSERGAHIQTPGWCRFAVKEMLEVAEKVDITPPRVKKEILVWPEASATAEEIHYALKVSDPQGNIKVYNPNPAALFPQYLGDFKSAPGFIPQMKVTEKVI